MSLLCIVIFVTLTLGISFKSQRRGDTENKTRSDQSRQSFRHSAGCSSWGDSLESPGAEAEDTEFGEEVDAYPSRSYSSPNGGGGGGRKGEND